MAGIRATNKSSPGRDERESWVKLKTLPSLPDLQWFYWRFSPALKRWAILKSAETGQRGFSAENSGTMRGMK